MFPVKRLLRAAFIILCCTVSAWSSSAWAVSQGDLYSINTNTSFFDPSGSASCNLSDSTGNLTAAAGKDTAKWQTTLQPPYSLEDFMVEVLRDVAGREGVPESSTVTQQHVLALVAFAWGEGGNLTNDDIYNPLNTGGNYPGINLATAHSVSGVQSYATFNDGVDAVARGMTGTGGAPTYQTRLGATLKDPNTTANQFMKALTYYQNYKDNLEWATASMPPNQTSYYQGRLSLVSSSMTDYKNRASTLIGPPGHNADKDLHSTHPLRYSFSGDTSSASGSDTSGAGAAATDTAACGTGISGGGVVGGDIVATALGLAWTDVTYPYHGDRDTASCNSPDPAQNPASCHHGFQEQGVNSPKIYTRQTYQDAWAKYNKAGSTDFTDCGVYVATVLHASGVAKDYPASGSGSQRQWAIDHPSKYFVKESPTVADLQPGDVLVNSEHTFIYVGHVADTKFTVAEASQFNHSPELDNVVANEINGFTLVRVKG